LAYYSQGAFTQEIVYNLPVNLRMFYIHKLIEAKEAEKEQMEKSKPQQASPRAIPKKPI